MSLSVQNTEKGADLACQALAKVAITMNPEVAFPGQRVSATVFPCATEKLCCNRSLLGKPPRWVETY